jgi:hypothetical protein
MAFTDMNDVEQELGEEKPPEKNGNRTFLIIAGTLAGIMVLALLCIGGLAIFRFLPNQRATQEAAATKAAQSTAIALASTQTASVPTATTTTLPTYTPSFTPKPTNTPRPTNTAIVVIGPTGTPTVELAVATRDALLTQIAATHVITTQEPTSTKAPTDTQAPTATKAATSTMPPTATQQTTSVPQATSTSRPTSTPLATSTRAPTFTPRATSTALPTTGIADELGVPGLLTAAFVLIAIIFLVRRLRTAS